MNILATMKSVSLTSSSNGMLAIRPLTTARASSHSVALLTPWSCDSCNTLQRDLKEEQQQHHHPSPKRRTGDEGAI